jgi:hypothetical protein
MRQELLTKKNNNSNKAKKDKDTIHTTECSWNEPFVLYYDEHCDADQFSTEESQLKFRI